MSVRDRTRRHSRTALERVLAGLLERTQRIASDPTFGMEAATLAVFGSYLDRQIADHGDLDVAFKLRVKRGLVWGDVLAAAQAEGYRPWNPKTWHLSPDGRVIRMLRARSPIIALHELSELEQLGCGYEVIFEAA